MVDSTSYTLMTDIVDGASFIVTVWHLYMVDGASWIVTFCCQYFVEDASYVQLSLLVQSSRCFICAAVSTGAMFSVLHMCSCLYQCIVQCFIYSICTGRFSLARNMDNHGTKYSLVRILEKSVAEIFYSQDYAEFHTLQVCPAYHSYIKC